MVTVPSFQLTSRISQDYPDAFVRDIQEEGGKWLTGWFQALIETLSLVLKLLHVLTVAACNAVTVKHLLLLSWVTSLIPTILDQFVYSKFQTSVVGCWAEWKNQNLWGLEMSHCVTWYVMRSIELSLVYFSLAQSSCWINILFRFIP
jgi:hypothetical protein